MARITITVSDEGQGIKVESNPPAGPMVKALRHNRDRLTRAEILAASFFVDCLSAELEATGRKNRIIRPQGFKRD